MSQKHDFGTNTILRVAELDGDVVVVNLASGPPECYSGVTPELWAEWTSAAKPGPFFRDKIRSKLARVEIPKVEPKVAPEPGPESVEPKVEKAVARVGGERQEPPARPARKTSRDRVKAALKRWNK